MCLWGPYGAVTWSLVRVGSVCDMTGLALSLWFHPVTRVPGLEEFHPHVNIFNLQQIFAGKFAKCTLSELSVHKQGENMVLRQLKKILLFFLLEISLGFVKHGLEGPSQGSCFLVWLRGSCRQCGSVPGGPLPTL